MNLFCGVVNESSSKPSMEQNFAAILQVISSTPARSQSGWPAWDPLRLPSSSWQASIYYKGMHYPVVTVRLGWPPRGHCIMAKAGAAIAHQPWPSL